MQNDPAPRDVLHQYKGVYTALNSLTNNLKRMVILKGCMIFVVEGLQSAASLLLCSNESTPKRQVINSSMLALPSG